MPEIELPMLFRHLTTEEEAEFRASARTEYDRYAAEAETRPEAIKLWHPAFRSEFYRVKAERIEQEAREHGLIPGPSISPHNDEPLGPTDYQTALDIQDACNLSGVVLAWSRIVPKLWNEARARGKGTDFVNEHPICKLFADKLADLARVRDMTEYSKAYDICQKEASK